MKLSCHKCDGCGAILIEETGLFFSVTGAKEYALFIRRLQEGTQLGLSIEVMLTAACNVTCLREAMQKALSAVEIQFPEAACRSTGA